MNLEVTKIYEVCLFLKHTTELLILFLAYLPNEKKREIHASLCTATLQGGSNMTGTVCV